MKPSLTLAAVLAVQLASNTLVPFARAESGRPQQDSIDASSIKAPSAAVLEQIFNEATSELKAVEALVQAKSYGPAMLAAKKIVDRVSVVHPKANYSEHIRVSGILANSDLKKSYPQLTNRQKERIAIAVAAHKGGFYLDLLNLAKRAKLMYLRSMYNQMSSQLMNRDIQKLKEDLIEIHNIAIKLSDSSTSESFMVFDMDVANSDQQYFFNRELLAFAVEIKELKLTEDAFDSALARDRQNRLKEHWAGIPDESPQQLVNPYKDPNFLSCKGYISSYSTTEAEETDFCLSYYKKYQFEGNAVFASCYSSYAYSLGIESAVKKCMRH